VNTLAPPALEEGPLPGRRCNRNLKRQPPLRCERADHPAQEFSFTCFCFSARARTTEPGAAARAIVSSGFEPPDSLIRFRPDPRVRPPQKWEGVGNARFSYGYR